MISLEANKFVYETIDYKEHIVDGPIHKKCSHKRESKLCISRKMKERPSQNPTEFAANA